MISCEKLHTSVNNHNNKQNSNYYGFSNPGINTYYSVEGQILRQSNMISKETVEVRTTIVCLLLLHCPFIIMDIP